MTVLTALLKPTLMRTTHPPPKTNIGVNVDEELAQMDRDEQKIAH